MVRFLLPLFAGLFIIVRPAHAQQVRVEGGLVGGKPWNGSLLFREIPFAAPPIGKLGWQPPQTVLGWKGVRPSMGQTPSCLKNDYGWNRSAFVIGNEDCLTLGVPMPSLTGKRPVLVWVHGGSNRAGGRGDIVLSDIGKSVVLMGGRYRLGIFGFLSHPKLTAEQGPSGYYGLMDELAALKGVQKHVAQFGSDPIRVTIPGESAGSQNVSLMLARPAARHLFSRAIMESGSPGFGMPFRDLADAEHIGEQADAMLGTGSALNKCGRSQVRLYWRSTGSCATTRSRPTMTVAKDHDRWRLPEALAPRTTL